MDRAETGKLKMAAGALPRHVITVVAIVLLLLSSTTPLAFSGREATARTSPATKLTQQLVNPRTIRLGTGRTETRLDRNRDYIIQLPKGIKTGSTLIDGGRNVVINGGTIVMNGTGSDLERRAIYIKNATGTVRIQNVAIRGRKKGASFDAIAIAAPQAVVELVNVRVTGLHGRAGGYHGDIVQAFGGVKKLVIDGLTGRTGYQGFYLVETGGRIGGVDLRNVDLAYLGNRHNQTTIMLWFDGCKSYPVSLKNVYIKPRKGQSIARSAIRSDGCNPTQRGNKVSWSSNTAIDGTITQGSPPGGAYVSERRRR